jgi:hypothetical protein
VFSQVTSCNHSALLVLVYCRFRASTLHGVVHFQPMSLWSHLRLCVPILFDLLKRMSPPLVPKAYIDLEVPSQWKLSASAWILIKISSIPSLRWNYQMKRIDRWMQHWWESTTCSEGPRRRSCMGDWEVFLLPTVSISSFLHDQCILHRFLRSPSFHKSWDEILFKGGGL